ncbi:MAG: COG1361 S-layer family protein [Nanobdellota archaeon]
MKKTILIILMMIGILVPNAFAALKLDDVQFDPAIIAAGDEVDIIVQYHDKFIKNNEIKEGNPEYKFKVWLEPSDTNSEKYLEFFDSEGENEANIIFRGKYYNEVFRVKVSHDAPAGNYELDLVGQWYNNGIPEESKMKIDFAMPVKKEGIILGVGNVISDPPEIRSGDDYVKLTTHVENVGEKDAKNIELGLETPDGIESSYSNDNRIWVGRLESGQSKKVNFFIDVDEKLKSGSYDISYDFEYMDIDENEHNKKETIPIVIKPSPEIEVIKSKGIIAAGKKGELEITVKNTGEESAESVDVRLLLQNSQPFELDVRSDYIGELKPGEKGTAVFDMKVKSDAVQKKHNLKTLIRSKGDSDEGDDNIYTFNRRAELEVSGKKTNWMMYGGISLLLLTGIAFAIRRIK